MMNTRNIYLYLKGNNPKDIIDFLEVYENLHVEKLNHNYLRLSTDIEIDSEVLMNAREFSLVELYQDFTVFVAPKLFDFPIEEIMEVLPMLNPKIYTIETLIPELSYLNKNTLLMRLKNHYYSMFNSETIDTILGFIKQDMNASKTAKALYMHRNTLNYRLDNFISRTEIDVRKFQGALAIYLLFRR